MKAELRRLPLIAAAVLSLAYGLSVGLVRIGWNLPVPHPDQLGVHGPAMVAGFLGTLICLERAVAIGPSWAFAAPLACASGAVALLVAPDRGVGRALFVAAALGLAGLSALVVRRQPALHTVTMAAGAVAWLAGSTLWALGRPVHGVVLLWATFLVLTIAGERLDLSRLLRLGRGPVRAFVVAAAAVLIGAGLATARPAAGTRVVGVGFMALAVWLLRHDVARRTVRQPGLPRYVAVCLLAGYAWLGVAGALALWCAADLTGPAYDATLHAFFLGFALSMVFGHAPIIFPAVIGGVVAFRPRFYLHLLLLHASLAVRVAADVESLAGDGSWGGGRPWGGLLNAAAILLFLPSTLLALTAEARRSAPVLPRSA